MDSQPLIVVADQNDVGFGVTVRLECGLRASRHDKGRK